MSPLLSTSTCCTPLVAALNLSSALPRESRVHRLAPVCAEEVEIQNKPLHQSIVCMCLQDMSKNRPLELKGTRAYKVSPLHWHKAEHGVEPVGRRFCAKSIISACQRGMLSS